MPRHDSDGMGGAHLYMPWWLWDKKTEFPRGYHIELGGGYGMPGIGSFTGLASRVEGYGAPLKKAIYEDYGTHVSFAGRGEMIPNADTYCEIDQQRSRSLRHSGAEIPFQMDRRRTEAGRAHGADLRRHHRHHGRYGDGVYAARGQIKFRPAGRSFTRSASIRMGDDPKTSALNKYCQSHDVKNLFVADAAPFVSNPDKNPTLTICALAWRTAEYLAEEMRKGNV